MSEDQFSLFDSKPEPKIEQKQKAPAPQEGLGTPSLLAAQKLPPTWRDPGLGPNDIF